MIELFPNVPTQIKILTEKWIDLALEQENGLAGAKMIHDFVNSLNNEEEKDFVDFYFQLKMEQLKNEDNND